jgi:hypothetical protein
MRGEFRCDEPAQRVAGEINTLETGRIEPAFQPRTEICSSESPAEPGQIDDVNAVPLRERREQRRPPLPGTGEAVDKHEWLARSRHPVPGRATVDLQVRDQDRLAGIRKPAAHASSSSVR